MSELSIDLHCHIDLYDDPTAVIRECKERGTYVLSVTTVPSAFTVTESLAGGSARIRTALGLHPELAASRSNELLLFERLLHRARYVGEVGLDGSSTHQRTLPKQQAVLREVLRMCSKLGGRPITLHSRGATTMLLDLLEQQPEAGMFLLHWFVGSARCVARASDLGCWFTVGPAMFSSARGRAAMNCMPRDRVLPESDGPFGKDGDRPLFPWEASSVVPRLAELWGTSASSVDASMRSSFEQFGREAKKFSGEL